MDGDKLLDAARQEEAKLRSSLAQHPDYVKLQQVQRLIAVYEAYEDKVQSITDAAQAPVSPKVSGAGGGVASRRSEKLHAAEDWTYSFLKEKGVRMPSGDLYAYAEAAGHVFGGAVPSRSYASFLSNSKRFNNIRGLGYGLSHWGDSPGPNAKVPLAEAINQITGAFTSAMERAKAQSESANPPEGGLPYEDIEPSQTK